MRTNLSTRKQAVRRDIFIARKAYPGKFSLRIFANLNKIVNEELIDYNIGSQDREKFF